MAGSTQFKRAEFVRLQFQLRFTELIVVDLATLLRIRRSLRAAANYCFMGDNLSTCNRFGRLFSPELSCDPVAQRQFQKSSPAFVFHFDYGQVATYQRGDLMTLNVIVWGGNLEIIKDLTQVIEALGKAGLRHDAGRFEVVEIYAEDSACQPQKIWSRGESFNALMVPVRDGDWWLNSCALECDHIQLRFLMPSRLIVKQRPMFYPTFKLIFPFILRRVTSMLYAHCCLDLDVDAQALLAMAGSVETQKNDLKWNDWRELQGVDRNLALGGVEGSIDLYGSALIDLVPYLYLGSLMNLGKNAAYGAGRYRVVPYEFKG
ncbi:MAG: hypothetical protein BA874_02230 [Desulfuromonadales bacterium C00003068]|jgi:hypothetical protein|nr:MAG: hypothetical protein BA874_02230 [Desulfuromonadales bacterium C00003068]